MSKRAKVLKGSAFLTGGEILSQACTFIRNIILARILTKEDFGIAATFLLTVQLFELASKMSVGTLVIQSKDGEDPELLNSAHSFQAALSFFSALVIFLAARPVAMWFEIPETTWAFQLLAVVPLGRGFMHLDIQRMERDMHFLPVVCVFTVPQVIVTLAAWPLAIWLGDYRALLFIMLGRWAMSLVGSHVLAKQPFRYGFSRKYFRSIAGFGWPLLINGFFMFVIFQGDRALVGRAYTMADLGLYSVAATLAIMPGLMVLKVVGGITLPLLSRTQDNVAAFREEYSAVAQFLALFGMLFAVPLVIAGEGIVLLLYDTKYAGAGAILGWMAVAQSLRIIRAAPTIASMAQGDTKNLLISNIWRGAVGIALIIVFVLQGLELWTIAAAGVAAELVAFTNATFRVSRMYHLRLRQTLLPALAWVLGVALAATGRSFMPEAWVTNWLIAIPLGTAATALALAIAFILMKDLRKHWNEIVGSKAPFLRYEPGKASPLREGDREE